MVGGVSVVNLRAEDYQSVMREKSKDATLHVGKLTGASVVALASAAAAPEMGPFSLLIGSVIGGIGGMGVGAGINATGAVPFLASKGIEVLDPQNDDEFKRAAGIGVGTGFAVVGGGLTALTSQAMRTKTVLEKIKGSGINSLDVAQKFSTKSSMKWGVIGGVVGAALLGTAGYMMGHFTGSFTLNELRSRNDLMRNTR